VNSRDLENSKQRIRDLKPFRGREKNPGEEKVGDYPYLYKRGQFCLKLMKEEKHNKKRLAEICTTKFGGNIRGGAPNSFSREKGGL